MPKTPGVHCQYHNCEGCTYPESCVGSRTCKVYRQADYDARREERIAYSTEYRKTHPITDSARATKAAYKKSHKVETFVQGTLDNHRAMGYTIEADLNVLVAKLRATKICKYCKKPLDLEGDGHRLNGPSMDRTENGMTITNDNVQFICRGCNAKKGARSHDAFKAYAAKVLSRMNTQ